MFRMAHWTLDDIPWQNFDAAKADPALVSVIKSAALVEYNAHEYVRYLREVFAGDAEFQTLAEQWGKEETQHGQALSRWASLADPEFNFEASFKRFTEGYQQLPKQVDASVRGSRSGELIARCIVEMGTSNHYIAIKEYCDEPVLKVVAARIAADELRHYKLFYDILQRYRKQEKLSLWGRLRVAIGRVAESGDDELAYAYFAANTKDGAVYNRAQYSRILAARTYMMYRKRHVDSMAAMLFKAVGLKPHTRLFNCISVLAWKFVHWRASVLQRTVIAAA